jgi:hypothetical protein
MSHYENESEIEKIVRGFEWCRTAADDFKHADHLAVAAWYLRHSSEEAALAKMREGLLRFLTYHGKGTQKYNETITLFWLKRVSTSLDRTNAELSWLAAVNSVIESLGNSRLIFEHYSEGLLQSAEAKSSWVAPDLKPL